MSNGYFYKDYLERSLNETERKLELALIELRQCRIDLFEAEDKFHVLSFYINDKEAHKCAKDRSDWMGKSSDRVKETLKKIEYK